jgi:hypothetical protein
MGRSAKKKIDKITWRKVGEAIYEYLSKNKKPTNFLQNPYKKTRYRSMCRWTGRGIYDFTGEAVTVPEDGSYVVYADPFVAINAQVRSGKISSLAVRVYKESPVRRGTRYKEAFIYASKAGIPKILPGSQMTSTVGEHIQIVNPGGVLCTRRTKNTLHIKTPNVAFSVEPGSGDWINLRFQKDHRFGYARGILGSTLMKKYSFHDEKVLPQSAWRFSGWKKAAFVANPKSEVGSRYKGVFYGAPRVSLGKKIKRGRVSRGRYRLSEMLSPGKRGGLLRQSFLQEWGDPVVSTSFFSDGTLPKRSLKDLSLEQYIVLDYVSRKI